MKNIIDFKDKISLLGLLVIEIVDSIENNISDLDIDSRFPLKFSSTFSSKDSERTHFKMAAADFIFTFALLLLFANRPFSIIDSALRMIPSDAYLSLCQLNWSGSLFSRPYVRRHVCVVWIVAGYGFAHSAQSRFARPLEVSSSRAGCVATTHQQ